MSKRRAIGRALSGFAETYLPAMQAMQDRRYQEALADKARAEADQLLRTQEFLDMIMSGELGGLVDEQLGQISDPVDETGELREIEALAAEPGGVMLAALQRDPPSADEFFGGGIGSRSLLPDETFSPEGPLPLDESLNPGLSEGRENLIGQALQAQGGLTTDLPIRPSERLLQNPDFRSGVEDDYIYRTLPDPPPQFDPRGRKMRQLSAIAGVNPGTISAMFGPEEPTPAFKQYTEATGELLRQAMSKANAAATKVTYTDADGQTVDEYINIEELTNPGIREFLLANGYGHLLKPAPQNSRVARYGINAGSAIEHALNIGVGSSSDVTRRAVAGIGNGPDGVLAALQNESKLGIPQVGALGGISMVQLSADQQKHLMQLIPLFGVTEQIIELARDLNDEEVRWAAMVDRAQENWYSWWGWDLDKNKEVREGQATGLVAGLAADARADAWITGIESEENLSPGATDKVRLLARLRNAFAGLYAELGGERGRKTEEDVRRAKQMIPGLGETRGVTLQQSQMILDQLINTYYGITRGPIAGLREGVAGAENLQRGIEREIRERQPGQPGTRSTDVSSSDLSR